MVTVKAFSPGRVNLIGDHTDYAGGACLPFAIEQGTTVSLTAIDGEELVLTTTEDLDKLDQQQPTSVEPVETTRSLDDLERPTGTWTDYVCGTFAALALEGVPVTGLRVEVSSDLPVGAGLSSSAALSVAAGLALLAFAGTPVEDEARQRVAAASRWGENYVVGAPTGGMDQSAVLFGGAGKGVLLDFANDPPSRQRVPLDPADAGLALLLADSGVRHRNAAGGYAQRRRELEAGQADRARHVRTETARVHRAANALRRDDWHAVGDAMTASHRSLRDDYEVSVPEVDALVEDLLEAGALGARMTGGGFGGSVIALMPSEAAAHQALLPGRSIVRPGAAARVLR